MIIKFNNDIIKKYHLEKQDDDFILYIFDYDKNYIIRDIKAKDNKIVKIDRDTYLLENKDEVFLEVVANKRIYVYVEYIGIDYKEEQLIRYANEISDINYDNIYKDMRFSKAEIYNDKGELLDLKYEKYVHHESYALMIKMPEHDIHIKMYYEHEPSIFKLELDYSAVKDIISPTSIVRNDQEGEYFKGGTIDRNDAFYFNHYDYLIFDILLYEEKNIALLLEDKLILPYDKTITEPLEYPLYVFGQEDDDCFINDNKKPPLKLTKSGVAKIVILDENS